MTVPSFVSLDRTFHSLPRKVDRDEYDLENLVPLGAQLTWPELLRRPRVVILSEAGAGKTWEIREQSRRLRQEGKAAFFIRLEHVRDHFESAFEEGDFMGFTSWAAGMDEGWLLLDSVDETRLRSPRDFEVAIRIVAGRLAAAMARVHVVITSRPYAWRAQTDLRLCEQHLPVAPSQEFMVPPAQDGAEDLAVSGQVVDPRELHFSVVALDDLSAAQVRAFAVARGIKDATSFRDAAERAGAFTARPQDVEELLEFWTERGRVGSRLELMQASVRRRLNEPDPDRDEARPLTFERTRMGARLTAAACILTRTPNVQTADPDGAIGVDLRDLFPDWDAKDRATLLSRPVFDEAIYGAVRFHHRSVREFLCAEWFADLLGRQASRREIEQLLFREQYEQEVIVPETRPVLPWLALMDSRIGERVQRLAPEVFFEGGDPSALPREVRRKILYDIVAQVSSDPSRRFIHHAGIERFASEDLTDDVKMLIAAHEGNGEILWFLLRMVWQGRLVGALPEAKTLALDPKAERNARIAAFRAVGALSVPADIDEVRRSFLAEADELDRELLAELVSGLEPTAEDFGWLLESLVKTAPKVPYDSDDLSPVLEAMVDRMPDSLLVPFVEEASELLGRPPFVDGRYCHVSKRFSWLLPSIGKAVLRLIERRDPEALRASVLAVLQVIPSAGTFGVDGGEIVSRLPSVAAAWQDLRWALFWRIVESERRLLEADRGERLRKIPVWSTSFLSLGPDDFEPSLRFMETRDLPDDQLIALLVAFDAYVMSGRRSAARGRLKRAAARMPELQEHLSSLLKPPPASDDVRRMKKMSAAWARRARQRERREARALEDNKRYIERNLEEGVLAFHLDPADGLTSIQSYLLQHAQEGYEESHSNYAANIWQGLIPNFGEPIARAFRDGAVGLWRRAKPRLVSEGAPQNSTPRATVLGLVGLTIEATETPDWPSLLTEKEAEIAFRHAVRELNRFPPWLPKVYERFADVICELMLKEIEYELTNDLAVDGGSRVLSCVSWSGQWIWDAVAPRLLEIVARCEPNKFSKLRQVLTVVQGSSLGSAILAEVAAYKARSVESPEHGATWFAVWVGVEPAVAIPVLAERLASFGERASAIHFAMVFVTRLVGSRYRPDGLTARDAYRTPESLKTLYVLVRAYVSEDEDVDRGNRVYSPELRDEAQQARDSLFSQLRDLPGKAAFTAMSQIAAEHSDPSFQSWALHYARTKAEDDANGEPWSTYQVREFNDTLERRPVNYRDLFDLASMRLQDLKADLEDGDASDAPILIKVKDETAVRTFLGNRLRERAFGRYSIPQEEEFADGKRVDLRFHAPALDAPVPVELKVSHRWSGSDFLERLENQLCGDYLRDFRSRFGFFVIVHQGERQTWKLPDKSPVDFAGLIHALADHWTTIAPRFPNIDKVKVLGIDLTKRSTP